MINKKSLFYSLAVGGAVLQGVFLLFAVMMIGCNLVADITYASLDPRVRRV